MTDFSKVTDFESLYKAYQKSKKGKGHNQSRLKFEMAALDGVLQIKRLLETKKYNVSPYNQFTVFEPKERVIEAGSFKDKIVQHSLCDNILLPAFQTEFIQTNVAGQINKGTLYGLECLRAHLLLAYAKYGYDCWIVKADVTKYFYRINHDILKDIVRYFIADDDVWWLCEKFIDSTSGLGLPLGNQVTQVFALLFLSGLDHFVTGELGVKYYGRYMDDFYLIVKDKSYARHCLNSIVTFMETLNLELNSKTQIILFKNGVKYCGFHTYVTQDGKCIRKLTNEKKRAAKKKYRRMAKAVVNGRLIKEKFDESYIAFKNHISHGNCMKFGYELDQMVNGIMKGSKK